MQTPALLYLSFITGPPLVSIASPSRSLSCLSILSRIRYAWFSSIRFFTLIQTSLGQTPCHPFVNWLRNPATSWHHYTPLFTDIYRQVVLSARSFPVFSCRTGHYCGLCHGISGCTEYNQLGSGYNQFLRPTYGNIKSCQNATSVILTCTYCRKLVLPFSFFTSFN